LAAFLAVLYAGGIAVPLVPPRRQGPGDALREVIANAQPAAALTESTLLPRIRSTLIACQSALDPINTDGVPLVEAERLAPPPPSAVAVLQYTSGSTGTPRGVMITHENIVQHAVQLIRATESDQHSVWVGWAPHFHDLGLFGGICIPLWAGFPTVLMPPAAFAARPLMWLEAVSTYRGTVSGAPNFAYDLCVEQIESEDCAGLDLSSWRVAGSAAEPIRMETVTAFADKFAEFGFDRRALCPYYGLAEATLTVTGGPVWHGQTAAEVSAAGLKAGRIMPPLGGNDIQAVPSCGRLLAVNRTLIVDPGTGVPLADDAIGEIWIDGPTKALGYWNDPTETERVFGARPAGVEGTFLRTGDLGFVRDDTLYVTGRIKDLIIIGGQNIYPQDLEATARAAVPGAGAVAAFAMSGVATEQAVLVIEQPKPAPADPEALLAAVREAVWRVNGVECGRIVLTRQRAIPKTSSGKLQRAATRAALMDGALPVLAQWQTRDEGRASGAGQGLEGLVLALGFLEQNAAEQVRSTELYLERVLHEVLGVPGDALHADATLMASGATSLAIMRVKRRLESDLLLTLDGDLLWREMTIRDLAVHLHGAMLESPIWGDARELEREAANIRGMSDEDVDRHLAALKVA
jgi:acyl-CoA synthetase (AMP-forming)/AMP-acid ligase II